MKITPEHIEYMRNAVNTYGPKASMAHRPRPTVEDYRAAGLSDKRYRFDLIYWLGLSPWLCEHVYPYANDDHIDTALRFITHTK